MTDVSAALVAGLQVATSATLTVAFVGGRRAEGKSDTSRSDRTQRERSREEDG